MEQLFVGVSIKPVSLDILPQKIAVSQMIQTETLMVAKTKKTPEYDLNIYICVIQFCNPFTYFYRF